MPKLARELKYQFWHVSLSTNSGTWRALKGGERGDRCVLEGSSTAPPGCTVQYTHTRTSLRKHVGRSNRPIAQEGGKKEGSWKVHDCARQVSRYLLLTVPVQLLSTTTRYMYIRLLMVMLMLLLVLPRSHTRYCYLQVLFFVLHCSYARKVYS